MIRRYIFFIVFSLLIPSIHAQLKIADQSNYLDSIIDELNKQWPANRTINLVFHGHSVPTGYFKTPYVNTFDSYPYLLHKKLKEKYPFAVINIITTSIGGENSKQGAKRFENDVLIHKPDVLFIDYALNDIGIGLDEAKKAWEFMIYEAKKRNIKIIILTPTPDKRYNINDPDNDLAKHAQQVKDIAGKFNIGFVDSYLIFQNYIKKGESIDSVMSQVNHPNSKGHEMVASEIAKWFIKM